MTRFTLIRGLRLATSCFPAFVTALVLVAAFAGCATSEPTSTVDKNRMAAAERIADRTASRSDQRSR